MNNGSQIGVRPWFFLGCMGPAASGKWEEAFQPMSVTLQVTPVLFGGLLFLASVLGRPSHL